MIKKLIITLMSAVMLSTLAGCQWTARKLGGSYTVELPKGEKLVNVTWKEDSLWYLTRPMKADEEPETYKVKEDSIYGLMEGTVTIKESR